MVSDQLCANATLCSMDIKFQEYPLQIFKLAAILHLCCNFAFKNIGLKISLGSLIWK